MKDNIKKSIKFVLILLPFVAIGGFFTGRYSFNSLTVEMQQIMLEQGTDIQVLGIIAMIQAVIYSVVCGILGYILSEKVNLLKPLNFDKNKLIKTLLAGVVCGIIFSLDYWTFRNFIPEVAASYENELTIRSVDNWIASILYGGIVEELMLRFFLMSLIVLIIWKLFFKNIKKEELPVKIYLIANIICALLFAAGHLPATLAFFGKLSVLIVIRCFLMNGMFGYIFGELYRKYGIQYAIVAHMTTHIVSKLIWIVFI